MGFPQPVISPPEDSSVLWQQIYQQKKKMRIWPSSFEVYFIPQEPLTHFESSPYSSKFPNLAHIHIKTCYHILYILLEQQ